MRRRPWPGVAAWPGLVIPPLERQHLRWVTFAAALTVPLAPVFGVPLEEVFQYPGTGS